jgi:hypothetical protein
MAENGNFLRMPMPSKLLLRTRCLWWAVIFLLGTFVFLEYLLLVQHHGEGSSIPSLSKPAVDALVSSTKRTSYQAQAHPICEKIPPGVTAASLWRNNLDRILNATLHPEDIHKRHTGWTQQLLQLLSPTVLQKGIRSTPNFEALERFYTKLHQRMIDPTAPPLKIFVFGGSIVEGVGCDVLPNELGLEEKKDKSTSVRNCAWPFRLEHFLHHLFGPTLLLKVENLSVGGTNSEAAIPVMDYWLSPVFEPKGADIIINAYSANDNLPPAFFATHNTTADNFHSYRILRRNIEFVQSAMSRRPCLDAPVVLYVNDYLGNQQQPILGEGQLDEMVQLLADWKSIGYISAAHMVRHWVLADTSETLFSPNWESKKGGNAINVHFGTSGHVTTMLAVAYAMLQTTIDFCEDSRVQRRKRQHSTCTWMSTKDMLLAESKLARQRSMEQPPVLIDMDLHEWENAQKASQSKFVIPSMRQVYLNNISSIWAQQTDIRAKQTEQLFCQSLADSSNRSPCVFAFLAAPLGTHQGEAKLLSFLQPFVLGDTINGGWRPQNNFRHGGFQNKLGLVATRPNATITFGFQHIRTPVRILTIQYLKSYGPRWENSRAKFTMDIFYKQSLIYATDFILEGFHDQNTSISYPFRRDLMPVHQAPVGSSIRFRIDLISGLNFKINAMMFCSQ